ncbi:MAG: hypothetical protein KC502_01135 [Myxococcales bacterium]|nr:hypothetical protein [Myxococcales bacterium]
MGAAPAPLLLQPGDPLPQLAVSPHFDVATYAGQWLLLVRCDAHRLSQLGAITQQIQGKRRCATCVVSDDELPGVPTTWHAYSDPIGRAADALGALEHPEGKRADVAVLLDPRGTVALSVAWDDTAEMCAQLNAVLHS